MTQSESKSPSAALRSNPLLSFWVAVALSVAILVPGAFLVSDAKVYFVEGGPVEIASPLVWTIAALALVWLAPARAFGESWHVPAIFLVLAAREMDFDKRFLETGIFKARLYTGDNPLWIKLLGLAVIFLILWMVVRLVRRNWSDLLRGMRRMEAWALAAIGSVALAVVSKTIDGAERKLSTFGISLSPEAVTALMGLEELMELAFALLVILSLCCFERDRAANT